MGNSTPGDQTVAEALKDSIGVRVVTELADRFDAVGPGFDRARLRGLADELEGLELKDRINLVADTIAAGQEYLDTLGAVVAVAGDETLDAWASWPLCSVIERHGGEHPDESLVAMETVTRRCSCEFAIRPFLEHHPDLTFRYLDQWVDDDDEAVRRLVSEGTRPLLPWGPRVRRLIDQPERAITLLDRLRLDPSPTVRRSVANHLNDVAKFNPGLVISTIERWMGQDPAPAGSLVSHALRTLVKSGNGDALRLLGFTTEPEVMVEEFACRPATIELGASVNLTATIRSTASTPQHLVVDFVIHHVKANGDRSPKVFKWKTVSLAPGETVQLTKSRSVRPISTRTYHPGRHAVDLKIAGQVLATTDFDLRIP